MSASDSTHAVWRPGVGLALWFSDADGPTATLPGQLPPPVEALVRGRTLRRTVPITIGSDTVHAPTITLGRSTVRGLLIDIASDDPTELGLYSYLMQGCTHFVAAGAVTPTLGWTASEWTFQWAALPSTQWRTWLSHASAAAPQVLRDNGGSESLANFCAEMIDLLCRERCASVAPSTLRSPLMRALLPDADATGIPADRAADAQRAWNDWADGVRDGETSMVLRLHEPEDADTNSDPRWRLQVCRRTVDADEPIVISRMEPAELDALTTEIATAVATFSPLSNAAHDRSSLDFLLDTSTVDQLLESGAATLAQSGVTVMLPRSIAEVTPQVSLRGTTAAATVQRAVVAGLAEIRDFQWQLALGDAVLDDGELSAIAAQKASLVRVRGVWVRADSGSLRRAAEFIVTQRALAAAGHQPDMGELLDVVTGAHDDLGMAVTDVTGLSWLDEIAENGTLSPPVLSAPTTLAATLRPYQQRGVEWLSHLSSLGIGAVLADDMGLGKTIQVIGLLCTERESGENGTIAPTLIVCPMSVVGNWTREIARFAPHLTVIVHHGPDRLRQPRFAAAAQAADVVITTFALATRDVDMLREVTWGHTVIDEAQHVKNVRTAAAKSVRAIAARQRIALTGTPVENRLEDLRAVIDLVNPGLLGSPSKFKARFAEAIERERDPIAAQRLSSLTGPFILRRVKTDPAVIADLPEKRELTVRANLTVEQAALYRAVTDDLMAALGHIESDTHEGHRNRTVLAALTRLKQICNHPAHFLADGSALVRRNIHRSGKLELLGDIVDSIVADNERALIFTQFTAFGEMLAPWLTARVGAPVAFLHGGVTRAHRDAMVENFAEPDGPPIMIASLKAGGTGLNLTAANHVIHIDRWWNPAVEDQATDRAYRIGQTRQVEVRSFVCIGTIEERIDGMIRDKRVLSDLTISSGEHWLRDIDNDALYDLMRLRDDAVGE